MKKNIAVIFGGQSSEHEISCLSAANVIEGLDKGKYEIHMIGITREGHWLFVDDADSLKDGSWQESKITAVISPDRKNPGIWKMNGGAIEIVPVDVAFPVLHGRYGEDGTIQGLFELAGIPYVGCGVLASSAGMDKISTKIFADCIGVRQAAYVADISRNMETLDETVREVEEKLGYPVFVKPSNAGSSKGVSKAHDREELKAAIALAKQHDSRVLIEETIVGREIECAVLGGENPEASMVGEILAAAEFYDYDAKYHNAESKTVIDPDLPSEVKEKIRAEAIAVFRAVSGFGLSRVDFFVEKDTNEVIFNEINTLPGFTNISMYPMLWEAMEVNKKELLDRLIAMAFER
ncbi:MAG: D-alanine--D-alanine ligase family protein [Eubacterium sp.]|nr:D-alanine--D-alanine ligase family protein [Eubacterium sp.]